MTLYTLAVCAQMLLTTGLQEAASAYTAERAVPRAERIADEGERLRARLELLEGSDLERAVRVRAQELLDGSDADSTPWFAFEDWTIPRRSLDFHVTWTSPAPTPSGAEEIPPAQDFEREDHPVQVILRYAEALAARDIDLLVVPIPARLQVYPEALPGVSLPVDADALAGVGAGTTRLMLELSRAGVEVLDLLPAFVEARADDSGTRDPRLYLGHDRHWSPRGASLAAELVAQRLAQAPWSRARGEEVRAAATVVVERGRWRSNSGQLPPRVNELWFQRVAWPDGAGPEGADRASPVLVLGDSFSNHYGNERSSFLDLLGARVGYRVDAITLPGGGAAAVWRTLARREGGLAGKKVVVWIFAVNALASRAFQFVGLPEGG